MKAGRVTEVLTKLNDFVYDVIWFIILYFVQGFFVKKKAKQVKGNLLLNLPDDMLLKVLQYCCKPEVTNTREYQSDWVQECTMEVTMHSAVRSQNLYTMA